ncbi:hypothetical protein WBP06_10950 [Novosphingobium sp. BL-8H]|uniref:hypothetical protein n=1 Tax=Novosphingobium sp. BL-8H TaxID=3127640 RepID=UPI003756FCC9
MVWLLASMAGGLLGIYLMQGIWEFVLFKRVLDDPVKGKIGSSIAGYLSTCISYGFTDPDGSSFAASGFLIYLLPGILVGLYEYRRGLRLRDRMTNVEETFG